jgi:hypothetical protein
MSKETRAVAVAIADSFDWKNDVEGLVICDPMSLVEAIDKALRDRDERAAKIAEDALPIGADDCDSCDRIRRIAARIRTNGVPDAK